MMQSTRAHDLLCLHANGTRCADRFKDELDYFSRYAAASEDLRLIYRVGRSEVYASVWRAVWTINEAISVDDPWGDPDKLAKLKAAFMLLSGFSISGSFHCALFWQPMHFSCSASASFPFNL